MAAAAVGVTNPNQGLAPTAAAEREKTGSSARRFLAQLPPEWAQRAREQLGEDALQVERQIKMLRAKLKGIN